MCCLDIARAAIQQPCKLGLNAAPRWRYCAAAPVRRYRTEPPPHDYYSLFFGAGFFFSVQFFTNMLSLYKAAFFP
jgi:hypothetical protein